MEPVYVMRNPNSQITLLRRCKLRLSTANAMCDGIGTIYVRWIPSPSISFKLRCDISHVKYNNLPIGPAKIESIKNSSINFDVFVTNINRQKKETKIDTCIHGDVAYPKTIFYESNECDEAKFHIINFIHYPGNLIADFDSNDWLIKISEISESHKIYIALETQGGYSITHIGSLRHKDGAFKFSDVSIQLDGLYYFFAFLSGRWCGPVLCSGFFNEKKLWETWDVITKEAYAILDRLDDKGRRIAEPVSGPRDRLRLTSGTNGWNWTKLLTETELKQVFKGFMKKWKDESWRAPLKTAIFLYIEANQASGGTGGAIILTQSALELLASLHKDVHLNNKPCGKIFKNIDADSRIRWLLEDLKIPVEIPSDTKELKNFCDTDLKGKGFIDGPRAITYLRNGLIHPDKKNIIRLTATEDKIKLQILWLGIRYLEMILLRLFEYNGKYANRLWRFNDESFKGGLGFLQVVPWGTSLDISHCENCPMQGNSK